VRPLIVLALAPILALGLALGAGTVVPDKAPKATLKPQAIVWDDRVFTSPTKFARWLGARDKSYQVWVQRHPGATWFHKVRASGTKAALAAPPAKSAKSDGGAGTDTGLVILVGLGGLVLGGAIMRILPAVTAGSVDRRRRALRSPPTPASVGVPRRLALPAPKPAPPRPATVYAPPRVYPTPAAAASEPARVVPLYIPPPPEPEVEPIVEPDRVAATAHEPQPVVAPTVLQPEPQPQTFVAPAPAAPEPERKPVVNGEPFVAAIAQPEAPVHVDEPEEEAPAEPDASSAAEPVETIEAEPAPPPEPLAVAEVQPAIEPEPVELPKLPGPPEEEPSLEPAAEAVPAAEPEEAEIEPEPEPKPEPIPEPPQLVEAPPPPPEPTPPVRLEPETEPVVQLPVRAGAPREWNIWELERMAKSGEGIDAERDEERTLLLVQLRQFANADGALPPSFDPVVRETFGELIGHGL
jgi:hypothetical protein